MEGGDGPSMAINNNPNTIKGKGNLRCNGQVFGVLEVGGRGVITYGLRNFEAGKGHNKDTPLVSSFKKKKKKKKKSIAINLGLWCR